MPYTTELGDSLVDLGDDIHRFLTTTIQATPEAQARKCAKEAAEFAAQPSVAEAADVLITVIGWCELERVGISVLLDAATRKMTTNLARTWEQQPDGTWQHVGGAA